MEDLKRAASLIENASIILVMAGAGMSAESGLKTYEEINSTFLLIRVIYRRITQ